MAKFKKFVERQLHRLCIAHVHPSVTPLHRECVRHSITLRDTGVTVAHSVSQPLTVKCYPWHIYMQTIVCTYIILWHSTIEVKSREVNCWFTELLRDFEDDERMLNVDVKDLNSLWEWKDNTSRFYLSPRLISGTPWNAAPRYKGFLERHFVCIHTIKAQLIFDKVQ